MYITSVSLTISLPTTGKTHGVPPGLERRHLDLPPGIAKKIDAGGEAPTAILRRFQGAEPSAPDESPDSPDLSAKGGSGSASTLDVVV